MPQLRKVALAIGNKLAYTNTYEEALTDLIQQLGGNAAGIRVQNSGNVNVDSTKTDTEPKAQKTGAAVATLEKIRAHLQRYREFAAKGQWADAGNVFDSFQQLTNKN
jgi:uncharacterized protein